MTHARAGLVLLLLWAGLLMYLAAPAGGQAGDGGPMTPADVGVRLELDDVCKFYENPDGIAWELSVVGAGRCELIWHAVMPNGDQRVCCSYVRTITEPRR